MNKLIALFCVCMILGCLKLTSFKRECLGEIAHGRLETQFACPEGRLFSIGIAISPNILDANSDRSISEMQNTTYFNGEVKLTDCESGAMLYRHNFVSQDLQRANWLDRDGLVALICTSEDFARELKQKATYSLSINLVNAPKGTSIWLFYVQ